MEMIVVVGVVVAVASAIVSFSGFCTWKDGHRMYRGTNHWSDRHYRGETLVGLVGVVAGVLVAVIASAAQ